MRILTHGMVLSLLVLTGLFAAPLPGPDALSAQTVRGRLIDRESGAPVEGALTVLVDEAGNEHDRHLTDASGRFVLEGLPSTEYTVRADRIGFGSITSARFLLSSGQALELDLETGWNPIELDGITVEADQRCSLRPEHGAELWRVWDEARKALTVQALAEREARYRFRLSNYTRELDAEARRVLEETRQVRTGVSMGPIRSRPVEDLVNRGFIQEDEDGRLQYFGPDAAAFLSDLFLDTHCFKLAANDDEPGLIGLAFESVRPSRMRGIHGTAWIDRESSELRFLEFRYDWAPHPVARGRAQGRVEFEALPDGGWIVRRWWIRMPQLARGGPRMHPGEIPGYRVSGIREVGGEVLHVADLRGQSISDAVRGAVAGTVWDSTRAVLLEGARVVLSGTAHAGRSDATGRFAIQGVPEGTFLATFTHPHLDSLGAVGHTREVAVVPGEVVDVRLATPSREGLLAAMCADRSPDERFAALTGLVTDPSTGQPIPQASVTFRWQEVGLLDGRLRGEDQLLEVVTDAAGRFTVCDLPVDELVTARAAKPNGRTGPPVEIRLRPGTYSIVDLVPGR